MSDNQKTQSGTPSPSTEYLPGKTIVKTGTPALIIPLAMLAEYVAQHMGYSLSETRSYEIAIVVYGMARGFINWIKHR